MLPAYYVCFIYSNELQITFIMAANTMNAKGENLIRANIACNMATKEHQQMTKWRTLVVNGRKGLIKKLKLLKQVQLSLHL